MRHILMLLISFALLYLVACGSEESAVYDGAETAAAPASDSYNYADHNEASAADYETDATRSAELPAEFTTVANPISAAQQRKIIFNARVQLVVDEFEGVPKAVRELTKQHGGFIASSNIQGSEGEPRRGDWTLRIPSQHFDTFLDGSKALGQVRSLNQDSQEVTAEFVDLEARARNLRVEEERLHKHLNESTRSLKDILAIEREIARVRGQVERIDGRLNVLKDLTSLSTVTLSIEEIKDFVPEATEEPGYTTQVARTWDDSTGAVGGFFTNLSLGVVGFVPWLAVVLPVGLIAWLVLRGLRRHHRRPVPAPAKPYEAVRSLKQRSSFT